MATTGNVSIRFSVQDAEVVRRALEQLGKDGETALARINAASQTPSKGLSAISDVVGSIKDRLTGLAFSIGPAGTALVRLGPIGLVAAGAIGAVVAALGKVKEGDAAFGQYARDIKELGDQTSFAAPQLQVLLDIAQRHGVAYDQASQALNRVNEQYALAKKGSGDLYNELRRLDPQLAEQFASSRSLADALGVLSVAQGKVSTTTQALLNKFAFGKGGAGMAQVLQDIAGKGGLDVVTDSAVKAGTAFQTNVIDKMAAAAVEAERKSRLVEQTWNSAYAAIYERWKDFKKAIGLGDDGNLTLNIAIAIRNAAGGGPGISSDDLRKNYERIQKELDELSSRSDAARPNVQSQIQRRLLMQQNIRRQLLESDGVPLSDPSASPSVPLPQSRPVDTKSEEDITNELTRRVQAERLRLSLLGDVASTNEKIKAREDEINLARRTGSQISTEEAERVKQAAQLQLSAGDIAIRARLGVASAAERLAQTEKELALLQANGKISDDQRTAALGMYRKELEETVRAEEVRRSYLPGLTQLGQDAGNALKQIDQVGTTSLNNLTSNLADITTGTVSASQGFKNLGMQVIRSLEEMLIKMTIVAPPAKALQGIFSGFMGGAGGPGLSLTGTGGMYADGGSIRPGAWGIVGERGPELIKSSAAGTQVFSNSQSRRMMSSLPGFASGGFLPAPGGEDGDEAVIELRKVTT